MGSQWFNHVCSMVNKAMFVGAVASAIDLRSNGALFFYSHPQRGRGADGEVKT